MFFRRLLLLLLVGLGVGSPWLVRDWLHLRSPERRSGAVRTVLPVFPRLSSEGDTAAREPYAFAQRTRRLFQGFFGGEADRGQLVVPSTGHEEPTATSRSDAIVRETAERLAAPLASVGLRSGDSVLLRLFKEEGELEIWMKPVHDPLYALFKIHRLSAVAGRPGPKLREGDGQAPEGFYAVFRNGLRPQTRHHLGLDLGFPNELDRALGRRGSEVLIHGGGASAAGGYALAPAAMEEVYTLVEAALRSGQASVPVHLFPFRLTDRRMDQIVEEGSRWTEYWVQLKEGYDFFDNVRLPPAIDQQAGRPLFELAGRN